MPPSRRRLHLILLPLAALLATLPLLRNGPSCGHDFDFHLLSWLEVARQFSAGHIHPHWAVTPAFGAGEPRFVFYPPLSWSIGGLLTLLLAHLPGLSPITAFTFTPIVFTWLALVSAGLAMDALARRYTSPNIALVAAAFYLSNPYTLFTAYERSAYAELLAAAWIPLLLLALLPRRPEGTSLPDSTRISIPRLALAVALLWLTNAPAAVMGCYTVALLAILHLASLYRRQRPLGELFGSAVRYLAGTSLGLALAAFYILPAAFERRWDEIAMATIPGMRIADNTLFHHTPDPDHDAVLHTASLLAVLLLCTTIVALLGAHRVARLRTSQSGVRASSAPRAPLAVLATLTIVIAFLLTPLASPVWRLLPELSFLQFPWRLLAILAPVLALAIALALPTLRTRTSVTLSLLLPLVLASAVYPRFRQICDTPDTPAAQLALFLSGTGTDPTDEYTPVTADNDALHPGTPSAICTPSRNLSPPGPSPLHLDLDTTGCRLVLNLRDFPAWHILRNGATVTERLSRDDGLVSFDLPAGHSHIDILYAATPDAQAGTAISLVAFCIFVPLAIRSRRRAPVPIPSS